MWLLKNSVQVALATLVVTDSKVLIWGDVGSRQIVSVFEHFLF